MIQGVLGFLSFAPAIASAWDGRAPSPELLLGGRAVQRVLQLRLQRLQLLPQVSLLLLGLVSRGPFRVQVLLQVRDVALQLPDLLQGVVLLSNFIIKPARDRAPELRPWGSGPLLSHGMAGHTAFSGSSHSNSIDLKHVPPPSPRPRSLLVTLDCLEIYKGREF